MSQDNYRPKHDDKDTNVDIDIKQDMELDVELAHKNKSEVDWDIKVDAPDKSTYTKVDVSLEEKKTIYDKTVVEFTETVDKNISVSVDDWNVDVDVKASNIIESSTTDADVNDIDNSSLIDVSEYGRVTMDDFMSDQLAIGNSFNGPGNDLQFDINQSNELEDNDDVRGTTVSYDNEQAPNVSGSLEAEHSSTYDAHGYAKKDDGKDGKDGKHDDYDKDPRKGPMNGHGGSSSSAWAAEAEASGSLAINLDLTAPENAFQTVVADGGSATAGDGISYADVKDVDGSVAGSTSASADGVATAEAFNANIMAGGNQQANFATLDIVGGNLKDVGDVGDAGDGHGGHGGGYPQANTYANGEAGDGDHGGGGGHGGGDGLAIRNSLIDDDVNDLDSSSLIDVDGALSMDDFTFDLTAIGNSFNGAGNDMQFDVNQANDLIDNDNVSGTNVSYTGSGWNGPFQDVTATGGTSTAGDGIGNINADHTGAISGSAAATGDALASAQAFTANIVVGANLQVNNFTATVVGGDSFVGDDLTN